MVQFLVTSQIASSIERLIIEAEERLILISPYVQLSDTLKQRLESADHRGVDITLVYGKERELHAGEKAALAGLTHLTVRFMENLHAKCYYNENELIVTSLNLYKFSAENNREMGVRATNNEDLYAKARAEAEDIIRYSTSIQIGTKSATRGRTKSKNVGGDVAGRPILAKAASGLAKAFKRIPATDRGHEQGHCIRCGSEIDHNPERPFCFTCYKSWAEYENPTYPEVYCHSCGTGTKGKTSFAKPECRSCYAT